jgi:hypothetical protein
MSFLLSLTINSFVQKTSHRRKTFLLNGVRQSSLDVMERSSGDGGMQAFMVASDSKCSVRVKVPAEIHSSQFEHRFGHRLAPARPRPFRTVLHQMLARPFDDSSGNRPSLPEVLVRAHVAFLSSLVSLLRPIPQSL